MDRTVQCKVLVPANTETGNWHALQQARQTVEEMDGVDRIIGLITAESTFDMRTASPALLFSFRVEANDQAP